ncbi:50S ribosomal protein L10 [Buchnera aphidicola]|uniref:50S ribosomal protein L10 n=1 Tax=Buchnera aphidicola TaxID=9 RepID=UPI0034646DE5
MALNLQQKKNIVCKINKIANSSLSAIIAENNNICVNDITQLRKNSRSENVEIHVVKNTLLKLSFQNTHLSCLNDQLKGPALIGFSMKNPGNAEKIFKNFKNNNKKIKIITAAYQGRILSKQEINYFANLPSLKEAIMSFMYTMKHAAIGKFLLLLLNIKKKKETLKK